MVRTTKTNSKINQINTENPKYNDKLPRLHTHPHKRNTNKRRTHAQSNYTNTKLKAWFRCLLRYPARKRSGPILHPQTHTGVQHSDAI